MLSDWWIAEPAKLGSQNRVTVNNAGDGAAG
jgi:hypothetical protein